MGVAEAVVLAGVVGAVFLLLRPSRDRLAGWIARRFFTRRQGRKARVVVLGRRDDGTFTREDRNGG
jgi:hypothetical protein